ncbi:hypothetical protein [Flavobacterium sp.]|uniref:hypothetical protein n=1 Tax=Flavobacterium sp. TaxID=239 RepID=UPI0039E605F7
MKKASSIELMIMGICLIPLAIFTDNWIAQAAALVVSIALNIAAVVKSFKEKNEEQS